MHKNSLKTLQPNNFVIRNTADKLELMSVDLDQCVFSFREIEKVTPPQLFAALRAAILDKLLFIFFTIKSSLVASPLQA